MGFFFQGTQERVRIAVVNEPSVIEPLEVYCTMICPPLREIIHSLKLVDYLLVQADKQWYNYYLKPNIISTADTSRRSEDTNYDH